MTVCSLITLYYSYNPLYHTIPTFNDPRVKSLLKILREKEKMLLVTSIFSVSHNVFHPIKDQNHLFKYFILSSANAFNLDRSKILLFGKELIIPFNPLPDEKF